MGVEGSAAFLWTWSSTGYSNEGVFTLCSAIHMHTTYMDTFMTKKCPIKSEKDYMMLLSSFCCVCIYIEGERALLV